MIWRLKNYNNILLLIILFSNYLAKQEVYHLKYGQLSVCLPSLYFWLYGKVLFHCYPKNTKSYCNQQSYSFTRNVCPSIRKEQYDENVNSRQLIFLVEPITFPPVLSGYATCYVTYAGFWTCTTYKETIKITLAYPLPGLYWIFNRSFTGGPLKK